MLYRCLRSIQLQNIVLSWISRIVVVDQEQSGVRPIDFERETVVDDPREDVICHCHTDVHSGVVREWTSISDDDGDELCFVFANLIRRNICNGCWQLLGIGAIILDNRGEISVIDATATGRCNKSHPVVVNRLVRLHNNIIPLPFCYSDSAWVYQ
jgi:hypothetical protein